MIINNKLKYQKISNSSENLNDIHNLIQNPTVINGNSKQLDSLLKDKTILQDATKCNKN